jgi:hypothetical protein
VDGGIWIFVVIGAGTFAVTMLGWTAQRFGRAERRRRRARKTPMRAIRDARSGELIRIRGVVHALGEAVPLPFSEQPGVYHSTQLVDMANPGQTTTFTRSAQCEFVIDDGTGRAHVPREVAIELHGREPAGMGIDVTDPQVPAFLGGDKTFSKGGAVIWRQLAIRVGDQVTAWGRVTYEPESDPTRHTGLFRDEPRRVALVPNEPDGALVIEQ